MSGNKILQEMFTSKLSKSGNLVTESTHPEKDLKNYKKTDLSGPKVS